MRYRKCFYCGTTFEVRVKDRIAYCSEECRRKRRRECCRVYHLCGARYPVSAPRPCKECGRLFLLTKPSSRAEYCGPACREEARRKMHRMVSRRVRGAKDQRVNPTWQKRA